MSGPARAPDVRFAHDAEAQPAGRQTLTMLDACGRCVGSLVFRVCHPCGCGYIDSVAVATHWQGQGLGRHALHTALATAEGHTWSTSRQSAEGRRFFAAMADETETAFPPGGAPCPHMTGRAEALAPTSARAPLSPRNRLLPKADTKR
ncbi:GNAT family N-acetyltransferase [Streptomyces alfalfae]|uniref:GNAT family N-acetyltransferase n=1 Tax=Streptomyces alfalfae TaxID=1642299 RepID=UPI002810FC87|nr:GNAT family N-acetyltransferase [Streptomyces alfalfae]